MEGYASVIPKLGRQRQAEPWSSLASWPSLVVGFLAGEILCLKANKQTNQMFKK